ncbi:hypothetical protein CJ195_16480 [Bacillus sp. UMB0899]|nr:hypothetical protein CJ195_16480 [Bacillus sp. UMB0899]
MKKVRGILFQFIFAFIGIIFIGSLPSLFGVQGQRISLEHYFGTIRRILLGLMNIKELKVNVKGEVHTVYPQILDAFFYSFIILFIALIIAYIFSIILTFITMRLPQFIRDKIRLSILILESLPDILVIFSLQLIVIYIFKKTDILIMRVVTIGDERAYLLPIICLSIIPIIQLYRINILLCEDELKKTYVELTKSKGLNESYIILVHVLRNTLVILFFHSKKTIWSMLSTLVAIELLYGITGVTYFLTQLMVPEIFTILLLGFFIPIFFFYQLAKWIIEITINKGEMI